VIFYQSNGHIHIASEVLDHDVIASVLGHEYTALSAMKRWAKTRYPFLLANDFL
jgi:hypothetical protein